METKETLYNKQAQIFSDSSEAHQKLTETWFDETTADFWRHNRMYEAIDCLLHENDATWLTVGDGRWGLDAIRMQKRGIKQVLPTDICETLLKKAKEQGLIAEYRIENAEQLSFADNSFDYIFCKESYHHFPRPYIALYEMLRVASKGVFLVEPNDEAVAPSISFKNFIRYKIKSFLARHKIGEMPNYYGKPIYHDSGYETSGNYVYGLSVHEIQKVCQGLNYPQMLVKGINDHYIEGCEFEPADESKSEIFKAIKTNINRMDERCKIGKAAPALLMIGLFKETMDDKTRFTFENQGWTVVNLPRNPYIE